MATFGRREATTRTVDYTVPAEQPYGACWVEVMKAIHAATAEMRELGLVEVGREPYDDQLWVLPHDDEILVRFVADGSRPKAAS